MEAAVQGKKSGTHGDQCIADWKLSSKKEKNMHGGGILGEGWYQGHQFPALLNSNTT